MLSLKINIALFSDLVLSFRILKAVNMQKYAIKTIIFAKLWCLQNHKKEQR